MAHFRGAERPEELIALAWYLEAGSRAFYAALAGSDAGAAARPLFAELVAAEEHHMEALARLHRGGADESRSAGFPQSVLPQEPPDGVMEGGVEVTTALAWARGATPEALLEYCISLEMNSYDLYLRMRRATAQEEARRVFDHLAAEEQSHLRLLSDRFEELLGKPGLRGEEVPPPPQPA